MPAMYFIALVLPAHLNEQILPLKKYMLDRYDCRVGLRSPAHITLVPPFWMEPSQESSLTEDLQSISYQVHSFPLRTHHFSCFRPRTIFIATVPQPELDALKQDVDDFFNSRSYGQMKPDRRPFHPHITIATRDLHKGSFEEAWAHFSEKKWEVEWEAKGLSLLKHNQKNWDVIFTSQFKNLLPGQAAPVIIR